MAPVGAKIAEVEITQVREALEHSLSFVERLAPPSDRQIDGAAAITERDIRSTIKARNHRAQFFPADLFADPAWDILLALYAAELGQKRVSVTAACAAAQVPGTTALRWLACLEQACLITRLKDPFDGRRVFIQLSVTAAESMKAYFTSNRGHLRNP